MDYNYTWKKCVNHPGQRNTQTTRHSAQSEALHPNFCMLFCLGYFVHFFQMWTHPNPTSCLFSPTTAIIHMIVFGITRTAIATAKFISNHIFEQLVESRFQRQQIVYFKLFTLQKTTASISWHPHLPNSTNCHSCQNKLECTRTPRQSSGDHRRKNLQVGEVAPRNIFNRGS